MPELARDSRERWVRSAMGGLVLDRDFEAPEARAVVQAWCELTKSRVESNEAPPDTRPAFIFYHAFPEEP
ncbi:hypothetical protein [Nonomuraea jabiensis]|uniref:hypothetical protein n=1 Tax=Nonomuraea jabiensis TaxID=882448 RepID=UPI00369F7C56